MQIVIIGCGKTGADLALQLAELGEDVVVIERDSMKLDTLKDANLVRINGVPIDLEVLDKAGLESADAVLCVTDNENMNIMTGQIAKDIYKVPRVIVRTFLPQNTDVYEAQGLEPICTTTLTARAFIESIGAYDAELRINMLGTSVDFYTEEIDKTWHGKRVISIEYESGAKPFAILRGGKLELCDLDTRLEKGDRLVISKPVEEA